MPLSMPIAPTRIMIPAPVFIAGAGSPNSGVGTPIVMTYWALDAATQESVFAPIDFPEDWQTFNTFLWTITLATTASNNLRVIAALTSAVDTQTTNVTIGSAVTVALTGGATSRVQRSALETGLSRPTLASMVQASVTRVAADAADTYTTDMGLLGLELVKAS